MTTSDDHYQLSPEDEAFWESYCDACGGTCTGHEERVPVPAFAACAREYVIGPDHDRYSIECELEAGHAGKHSGACPFGCGAVSWVGGGYVAGDRLRARDVSWTHTDPDPAEVAES